MVRPRAGWFVVLFAATIIVSGWLPWRTTGSGYVSAIGGTAGSGVSPPSRFDAGQLIVLLASALIVTGAMTAQGLSARLSALAALVLSLAVGALTLLYYHQKVYPGVAASYGLYIGAVAAGAATVCSMWALIVALGAPRRPR